MVEHAADIENKFAVEADGRTVYERYKGKTYHRRHQSRVQKYPQAGGWGLMTESESPQSGVKRAHCSLNIVFRWTVEERACVSSAVRPVPDSESWNLGQQYHRDAIDTRKVVDQRSTVRTLDLGHCERPEVVPRELLSKREHLVKCGRCLQCRSIREGCPVTMVHSSVYHEGTSDPMKRCRREIEEADGRKMEYHAGGP